MTLLAYARSLRVGAVILLSAALLLPFLQVADLLKPAHRKQQRGGATPTRQASPIGMPRDASVAPDAGDGSALVVGMPADLDSILLAPLAVLHDRPIAGDPSVPQRRKDLERGPPFFL